MKKFYIAICDDEMADLLQEEELIDSTLYSLKSNIKWEIDIFTSSEDMLNSNTTYNMVFLDVEMDGLNGISTASALHKKSPMALIFFVTNHVGYMDEAMNKHAFRFWTKPIDRTRLIYGIQSAIKELNSYKDITVNIERRIINIPVNTIIYVYHENRYTYIVTTSGIIKTHVALNGIKEQLPKDYFVETHASCYVNLNYVVEYNKHDVICEYEGKRYNAFMSKRKYTAFDKRFQEWSWILK